MSACWLPLSAIFPSTRKISSKVARQVHYSSVVMEKGFHSYGRVEISPIGDGGPLGENLVERVFCQSRSVVSFNISV